MDSARNPNQVAVATAPLVVEVDAAPPMPAPIAAWAVDAWNNGADDGVQHIDPDAAVEVVYLPPNHALQRTGRLRLSRAHSVGAPGR